MYLFKCSAMFVRRKYLSLSQLSWLVKPKSDLHQCFDSIKAITNAKLVRFYSDKPNNNDDSNDLRLNVETIQKLERLALVDFDNEAGVKRLEEAVKFASLIFEVNTEGVKPMYTVLEDRTLELRPDIVEETSREAILKNASITEEDYFVAPQRNKPLNQT